MKKIICGLGLLTSIWLHAQNQPTYNLYMINPGIANPGWIDVPNEYGVYAGYRRQFARQKTSPITTYANGFINFSRNHGFGFSVQNDHFDKFNQLDASINYMYHVWLSENLSLGMGVRAGYQQQVLSENTFTYFDANEPLLSDGGLVARGLHAGSGLSLTSRNFMFNLSAPRMFSNFFANDAKLFNLQRNHFYVSTGYKFRFSDEFVFYPTAQVKGVFGSPLAAQADLNFLLKQLFWTGVGYKTSDNVVLTMGMFLDNGFRVIYNYETVSFSRYKQGGGGHEICVAYVRPFDEPRFHERRHIRKNGNWKDNW